MFWCACFFFWCLVCVVCFLHTFMRVPLFVCVWLPTGVDPPQGQNTIWIYFVYCSIWITKTGAHIRTHQSCFLRVCVCIRVLEQLTAECVDFTKHFPGTLLVCGLFHFLEYYCSKTLSVSSQWTSVEFKFSCLKIWGSKTGGWTATWFWVVILCTSFSSVAALFSVCLNLYACMY